MGQLTWMLSLLPDWFWTLILISGVLAVLAAWVLKFIPFVSTYRLPIQVGGILALLVGVYFQGVISNEEKWQARVKELELQVAKAEAQAKETTVKIEEKIIYKDRVIKERAKTQIEYIDRIVKGDTVEITKDMSEAERATFKKKQEELEYALKMCPVPQLVIEEINKAATKEIKK
jgi:membrane-bound lytic murein transglycosylase B